MTPVETNVVVREIRIAARPETIFSFFTDPAKMVLWKGRQAKIDPRPGGVYRVEMNAKYTALGEFVEVVPYQRIVFTWGWEGGNPVPPGSSTVEIALIPDGDGTIVRLTHKDLPAEARDSHREGWEHYLERLAQAAAGKDPGPDPWAAAS